VYQPGFVAAEAVNHVAVLPDGARVVIPPSSPDRRDHDSPRGDAQALPAPLPAAATRRVPLGAVAGARSGDKGGDANIGVWARNHETWRWLVNTLTVAELQRLLPETAPCAVQRHVLPNLRALNFVVEGLLGAGVASSTRFDPQAKALGEWLRSRIIEIPEGLV
jgi:hypothetical protein